MGNQESTPKRVIKKKIITNKQSPKPINNILPLEQNSIPQNLSNRGYTNPNINQNANFNANSYLNSKTNINTNIYENQNLNSNSTTNNKILERNYMSDIYIKNNQNRIINYPINSNNELDIPKTNLENIEFTPYNFKEEVNNFKKKISEERIEFENSEKERRKIFENLENNKKKFLEEQIKIFETKYNPWDILGLKDNDYNINNIKKAYKRNALKYHPDKAGEKYKDLFQLITQSYIYLLEKATDYNILDEKINKNVENIDYEDNINDKKENIYINKDNFDINKFNKIFEEYKIPNSFDKGYSNLMEENIETDENEIFGKNFNNDIFNAHFDNIKHKKKSKDLIKFNEPDALDSTLSNLNQTFFGVEDIEDFGSVNTSGLCYTDYKKAHVDENLLIDANRVKYKTYKSVDQLESERSNISHTLSIEDKQRYEYLERKKLEDDNIKLEKQKKYDQLIESNYNRINQRLIIHK